MRIATIAAMALTGLAGFGLAAVNPDWSTRLGTLLRGAQAESPSPGHGHGHRHGGADVHGEEGKVKLSTAQIADAGIEVAQVGPAVLTRSLQLPGSITVAPEQLAVVVARVPGLLLEARKRLGDVVAAGEVVAVIDSREIAEAAGDFLAAQRVEQLARSTYEREAALWHKRVSAEQDLLQARGALEASRIKLDQARQRLAGHGLADAEITALTSRRETPPRRYEVRAPAAGRVVDRRALVGAQVVAEAELYQVADLSTVLAELSAAPADLAAIKDGAHIKLVAEGREAATTVLLVGPQLDGETRRARVFARLDNADGAWRPGAFVTGMVETGRHELSIAVPRAAVHAIKGEAIVFVRTEDGFEAREVVLGEGDERVVEVTFGLDSGESVATRNSFVVKAELGKAEAEHSH